MPRKEFQKSSKCPEICLDKFLLFNPELTQWLICTPEEIVMTGTPPEGVPARVLRELMRRCKSPSTESLVELASLPPFFADEKQMQLWSVAGKQLSRLGELLAAHDKNESGGPDWLRVLVEDPSYLLTLIHSRLLLPTLLLVPPWNDPWTGEPDSQQPAHGTQSDEKDWSGVRRMLAGHNAALWRYRAGLGSKNRVLEVVEALEHFSNHGFDRERLLAARMAAEYLEVAAHMDQDRDVILKDLDAVWAGLQSSQLSSGHVELPGKRPFAEQLEFDLPDNVDLTGVEEVSGHFSEQDADQLKRLLEILVEGSCQTGNDRSVWICLNTTEIQKRLKHFSDALGDIKPTMDFDGLGEIGVEIHQYDLDTHHIVAVEPSKWLAMQNRLPEVTDEQVARMRQAGFSATAIFDTLLAEPLADDECTEPMWVTRVYRILDTMADFVPQHVQLIRVGFDETSDARPYSIPLPLPVDLDEPDAKQDLRKEIVALYLLTTALNYAVTLGTRRVVFDCGIADETGKKFAFNNPDLKELLDRFVKEHGFDRFVDFLQATNFDSFAADPGIVAEGRVDFNFTSADMRYGRFLGIDIGGSYVKVALFAKGESNGVEVRSFATFPEAGAAMTLEDFVERLLRETETEMGADFDWKDLDGIGISWPGAVRDSRITGFSGTLGRLIVLIDGQATQLTANSRPEHVQSVSLVEALRNGLRKRCPDVPDSLIVAMENDGNAEAYGNFCLLAQRGHDKGCWRLIMKLGTSLAGGAITKDGAVSNHIAEFAKPVFEFREAWRCHGGREGAVREFVSSRAVRNLTRIFRFEAKDVFGNLGGLNSSDNLESRIEAIEVGELLDFCIDNGAREGGQVPPELVDVLNELVANDNAKGDKALKKLKRSIAKRVREQQGNIGQRLRDYVLRRGQERLASIKAKREEADGNDQASEELPSAWEFGVKRVFRILGLAVPPRCSEDKLIEIIDADRFADAVAGSLAIFSQMGLHAAHLVVMLYNIYKSDRIDEVILAGGVTQGMSGRVICHQAEAFLSKYYDKIFGPEKNLKPGFLIVAEVDDLNVVGPYGAAMVANRARKLAAWVELNKHVEFEVDQLEPGQQIDAKGTLDRFGPSRMEKDDARQCLERLVSESRLLHVAGTPDQFVRPVGS